MKVFKFGGGVLKSSKDIVRLGDILKENDGENIIVVVSAFNKITSKFEDLINAFFSVKKIEETIFNEIKSFHFSLAKDLFDDINYYSIELKLKKLFDEILDIFNNGLTNDYHFEYDKIVSYGELLSSTIVYEFLKLKNINCSFKDSRNLIVTNSDYTEAKVDWELSGKRIKEECDFNENNIYISQGFVAADNNGNTTTLGREGSDFTASVFGYVFDADEVVFWKEVDGIYNSDPAISSDYELLPKLSYKESVEQAYYGAKILHPKTIKPLQNKKIPIVVKSFYKNNDGTSIIDISDLSPDLYPDIPIFIVKDNQILISVSTLDFSFISEHNLGEIFSLLSKYRIKVNLMQSSAINFSVCVTNNKFKVPKFISELKKTFKVLYNDDLSLITIRHYNNIAIKKMIANRKILLEQKSRHTVRFVVR
ncbi:MAG: aspartate kinase [Chlorobi bacterium]|nr:aspartate kinase [Chlorobiota bacterium]